MPLRTEGPWFKDAEGRKVLLRGVNLGGSTKMPYPDGATHYETDFSDHREVSFVGRPFPIEDAPEHMERLSSWGFNTLRLLTTWEAIEHAGPGIYDTKYLNYFANIVETAADHGLYVFIDPHQDVWSRMTGGDGAPGWTFEKVGIDFTTFKDNGAARVMQYNYPHDYKEMEWFMNYGKFGAATMFTLFFGSEDFAPKSKIGGKSIQDYLQTHFINSMLQIAEKVKDMENVIGFDNLNEPSPGYIGWGDITKLPDLKPPGVNLTPIDTLTTGAGYTREAKEFGIRWLRIKQIGSRIINPDGVSSWVGEDIWENHGVYDIVDGDAKVKDPHYFKHRPDGTNIDFFRDYLRPFSVRYIEAIREVIPDALLFIEGEPSNPLIHWGKDDPNGIVNASHWYDGFTLLTKTYRPWMTINQETLRPIFFHRFVKRYHLRVLDRIRQESAKIHGGVPSLVGEFGIPYDMNGSNAYQNDDFSSQIKALDHYYNLMDELQLHSTQWNYTSDNSNKWGDGWNLEDLSIYSEDQKHLEDGVNKGGRAIAGFCRPYPRRIGGNSPKWSFDLWGRKFDLSYVSDGSESEIYVPSYQFPSPNVEVHPDNVTYELNDQVLRISAPLGTKIILEVYQG